MVRKATSNSPMKGGKEYEYLNRGRQRGDTHRPLPWCALGTKLAMLLGLSSFCFKLCVGFNMPYIRIFSWLTPQLSLLPGDL